MSASKWVTLSLLVAIILPSTAQVTIPHKPVGTAPPLPGGSPHPPPPYMQDNINNYFGTAPDAGSLEEPVCSMNCKVGPLNGTTLNKIHEENNSSTTQPPQSSSKQKRAGDGYWLSDKGTAGKMPFGPSGYQLFRNVKDFGAKGDGVTDDTAAINRAAATYGSGSSNLRCGKTCGSTTTLGAVVYFPPGTYVVSTPIIQYYYTQFVGNAYDKPIIKGTHNFTGIALVDSDVYIPGGNGSEWYINQSNFYRQIRNMVFDMTGMNWTNYDNDQQYVPAGVHWQVGQATSITNCDFRMSVSQGSQSATAVGIYMENGSGGFVSDLTFTGGNIGFLAGSQQFTANNLQFTSCLTAIKQIWNWGFTWKNIYVLSCYVAIDCTAFSGVTGQGTGSITVLDSHFNGVPYAITLGSKDGAQPNIVLDNLLVENSAAVVLISGGETILPGSGGAQYFNSWASGYQVLPDFPGGKRNGFIDPAPDKPAALLDGNGAYFTRSKPQYPGINVVSATENGIDNSGQGDQTSAINKLLASNVGSVIFFPAGVYLIQGTVTIPVGSKVIGSAWSQIMGTGSYFADANNPKVMVQVGKPGDSGVIEISDMLFTVKGATAGAILMEWNVHESSQGSAAMWDAHFRVGGASGTNLQLADCPASGGFSSNCQAAFMLLHITNRSSGYFENVWAWVADHDLDNPLNADAYETEQGIPLNVKTDIAVYAGRGILVESQGPTWLYGSASEHAQLYQYQFAGAKNIYSGHMQTETPYYQPGPDSTSPYTPGKIASDPTFANCATDRCKSAWALRMVNSSDIFIYSAGFYSFFIGFQLGCTGTRNCQQALINTDYTEKLWMYNIFTLGNVQIVTPEGGVFSPLLFNATTQDGYTSEIAAYLALAQSGGDIGSGSGNIVTIDPNLWTSSSATVQCTAPCTYVLPPLTLPSPTTFSFPPLTTTYAVGWNSTYAFTYLGNKTTTTSLYTVVITTVITLPPVTTSVISWYDVNVTNTSTIITPEPYISHPPITITDPSTINGTTLPSHSSTRTYYPPPWPGSTLSPCLTSNPPCTPRPTISTSQSGSTTVHHTNGPPKPTCTHITGCGSHCGGILHPCVPCWFCPPLNNINCPGCGPGGVGGGGDGSSSECETATYTSCKTSCLAATPTSSCTTYSCKDVVGCDTTATDVSSGYTLAPDYIATFWEDWNGADQTITGNDWWPIASSVYAVDGKLPGNAVVTPAPSYIPCNHQDQDPGLGILTPYCVCGGSTFSESINSASSNRNSCAYTSKPSQTFDPHVSPPATPTPPPSTPTPPPPQPSGSLCFSSFEVAALNETLPYIEFIVHKPGDTCTNDNSQFLGQFPVVDECTFTSKRQQFKVCGTLANFVDEGDQFVTDGKCKTGFKLSINGVSYTGSKVDPDDDPCQKTCFSAGAFGTSYGEVIFRNVPICQ